MATPGPANLYAAEMWELLDSNPAYCGGKRRVKDTRYSVAFILSLLGNGHEVADIPKEYVDLEEDDIRACARWGAWVTSYQTVDINYECGS